MIQTMGAYNIISGNGGNGVHIRDSASTLNNVRGNIIGLGLDGDTVIRNGSGIQLGGAGVLIEDASSNTIGGDAMNGQGNVISGNVGNGVVIVGLSPNSAVQNKVLGNLIGTAASGTTARGNGGNGILVSSTQHTFIGVVGGPADRNIISGNALVGLDITSGAVDTQVIGNYIGTDKNGGVALG